MKKNKKYFSLILSLMLSIVLAFSVPNIALAGGGGYSRYTFEPVYPTDWDTYTAKQKETWVTTQDFYTNATDYEKLYILTCYNISPTVNSARMEEVVFYLMSNSLGTVLQSGSSDIDAIWNGALEECETNGMEVFCIDVSGNLTLSEEYIQIFREGLNAYIDVNAPKYWIKDTTDFSAIPPSAYPSKDMYDSAQRLFKEYEDYLIKGFNTNESTTFYMYPVGNVYFFALYSYHKDYRFAYIEDYNSDWVANTIFYKCSYNKSTCSYVLTECTHSIPHHSSSESVRVYDSSGSAGASMFTVVNNIKSFSNVSYKNGKAIMFFDTREHAIDYLTHTSPVYQGTPLYTGGDVVIPENAFNIDYDAIYDSIYNAIKDGNATKENATGSGLTAEEIQNIISTTIASVLSSYPPVVSTPSDGTTNSGTVSGNGYGGGLSGGTTSFIDGVSSFFESVLRILGMLYEYIGKFVDLVVDIFAKIVEIIPANFSNLLTAIFPFFPEEVIACIELMLVLALIVTIVKAFV